jgi:hypothetical protein
VIEREETRPLRNASQKTAIVGRSTSTVSLLLITVLASCGRTAAPETRFAPGPAARAHGVSMFQVLRADAQNLDVVLEGRAGRLEVRTAGGVSTQRLEISEAAPLILRTSWERVEVEIGEANQVLAERSGAVWMGRQPLAEGAQPLVALLLAMDIDLAVQGTSMAFQGRRYAWCTPACVSAERCARAGQLGTCGDQVATCGACLEQEPSE